MPYSQKYIDIPTSDIKVVVASYKIWDEFHGDMSIHDNLSGEAERVKNDLLTGNYNVGILYENGTSYRCGRGYLITAAKDKIVAELNEIIKNEPEAPVRVFCWSEPKTVYYGSRWQIFKFKIRNLFYRLNNPRKLLLG